MNNPLGLSDEEFLNQPLPETGGASGASEDENNDGANNEGTVTEDTNKEDPAEKTGEEADKNDQGDGQGTSEDTGAGDSEGKTDAKTEENPDNPGDADTGNKTEEKKDQQKTDKKKSDGADPSGSKDEDKSKDGTKEIKKEGEEKPVPSQTELMGFYSKVMAPFKANGKTIELKTPEEAIQLMQMGANYTRKLQELAPARKVLAMLQANGLDESKLSFFIDLDKGDKEAIKKLIKDKGIDPMDIDTSVDPEYREGSHTVSDEEMNFRSHLEELNSNPEGQKTLTEIHTNWDQASKDFLWQHPNMMAIIHAQRELGVYDLITTEMDRQKTLGQLLPTTSFLDAYKNIGDQLAEAGAFKHLESAVGDKTQDNKEAVPVKADPEPVVTRPAVPDASVDNGDKADATSPPRSTSSKAKETTNFLAMSDEDFLKSEEFRGRV